MRFFKTIDFDADFLKLLLNELPSGKYDDETLLALTDCYVKFIAASDHPLLMLTLIKAYADSLGLTRNGIVENLMDRSASKISLTKTNEDPKLAGYSFNKFIREVKDILSKNSDSPHRKEWLSISDDAIKVIDSNYSPKF